LLLAYYDPDGRLVYAGRAGTGINTAELERLWRRLQPLDRARLGRRRGAAMLRGGKVLPGRQRWVTIS
jgi:ATP-dependent DNA ligase